jgi:hypothetical protein
MVAMPSIVVCKMRTTFRRSCRYYSFNPHRFSAQLNRLANEMSVGKMPAVTETKGLGTVMEQSGPKCTGIDFGIEGNALE